MSTKPENSFIKGVHKYLESTYAEKMYNPYRSGTPDVWYSGLVNDLWIEYKYLVVPTTLLIPDLSRQQVRWIKERKEEGRDVWVIVGMPKGGVIIKPFAAMIDGVSNYFILSRKELAAYISNFCNSALNI